MEHLRNNNDRVEGLIIAGCLLFVLLISSWELAFPPCGIDPAEAAGLPEQRTVIVEAKLRPARFYQAPATTLATVYHPLVPDGVTEARYQPLDQNVLWRDDFSSGTGDALPTLGTRVDVGIDPTATVGNIIWAGDVEKYPGRLDRIRFLEASPAARVNENYAKP